MYYLKHQGPNLSLWWAHHRRTSFMKCTFHAACRRDQSSSGSLACFSLFRFAAPIPTDKMSQFKPNGCPIKITRVSEGDRQAERDSYRGWVGFGQVGSNWGNMDTQPLILTEKWLDVEHKCHLYNSRCQFSDKWNRLSDRCVKARLY